MVAKTPYADVNDQRHSMADRIINREYKVIGPNGERLSRVYAASQGDAVIAARRWAAENDITVDWTVAVA